MNHGRPQRMKNCEVCKKHIMFGSLLIGDEDTALTYNAFQKDLGREMYKSNTEETYEHLKPVDQLCRRYKFFLESMKGSRRNFFKTSPIYLYSWKRKKKTEELFEKTIKLMKMMIDY